MTYFGLTGGIASGKTTVARMFAALGARIVDADLVGHEMLRPSAPTYQSLVARFGKEIVSPTGEIDRRRLGAIVFADPARRAELDAIVHPAVIARVEELAGKLLAEDPQALVIVDAALIFEAGIGGHFRKMVVVWCRPEQQIERLIRKTGLSREQAEQRIAAQMPPEEKRRRADYLIDCSGTKESAKKQVGVVYQELKQLAGARPGDAEGGCAGSGNGDEP